MKTQEINGLQCTISYRLCRSEDGLYECKIVCHDGTWWAGYGETKPAARAAAESNMLDELSV